jgi:hypothetical protein
LHEDEVAVIDGNHFGFPVPQTMNAGHDKLAVFGLVIEVCDLAIRDQPNALGCEPGLQGQNHGVVLVVNGSLHARQSFDARELQHEAEQVTLELRGAVPWLEANVVDHMYQNSVSKNLGESQSVMRLAPKVSSSAWLSFSSSMRSSRENPIEATGTFARRLSTSLAIEAREALA